MTADMSDFSIRVSHEDLEELLRKELRSAIKCHKQEINGLERENVHPEHEDLVYSKAFIRAAAIVLKYYTIPKDWKELDEISDGK